MRSDTVVKISVVTHRIGGIDQAFPEEQFGIPFDPRKSFRIVRMRFSRPWVPPNRGISF